MSFDPFRINLYELEELKSFLDSGMPFTDFQAAGLHHQKQAELKNWLAEKEKQQAQESLYWAEIQKQKTADAYNLYLSKYPYGKYAARAQMELDKLELLYQELLTDLMQDMKEDTLRYNADTMQKLFKGIDEQERKHYESDYSPASRFLAGGYKLKYTDLVQWGVVPMELQEVDIVEPDTTVQARNIADLGEFPEGRTDVYFLGLPRSGKSSVLSGIFSKMRKEGMGYPIPTLNEQGIDHCEEYYNSLLKPISKKKPPTSTPDDTISFIPIDVRRDINKDRYNKLTFVEISGESFIDIANRTGSDPRKVWEQMGAVQCLKSNNRKILFFILDYYTIKGGMIRFTAQDQELHLEQALNVLAHDGTGKTGEQNCTFSKVDTVALIITKCDLMESDSLKGREEEIRHYLNENFKNFMNTLTLLCRKYDINAVNKNKLYFLPFSLGKFYVGNSFIYDETDSERLIDFILKSTKTTSGGGWFKGLFN
ncbi:hypothetical protein ACI760_03015 [Capnocytophaga canimorsus]|uniref:hypothetical protein n=1 Tax=Capnocytophaga canimorsus TaxID=28188 RepID=UPI00385843C9